MAKDNLHEKFLIDLEDSKNYKYKLFKVLVVKPNNHAEAQNILYALHCKKTVSHKVEEVILLVKQNLLDVI